jgi:hypothetical protein
MTGSVQFIQTVKLKSGGYAKFEGFNITTDPVKVRVRRFVFEASAITLSATTDDIDASEISTD